MITLLKDIYYSFPFQLLLLSFKRYQFLLFFWIFLFMILIGKFGSGVGTHAVLLDPEYLGEVGYLSFALVGIGFGAMYVTWNVSMYILNSNRFPFMASLQYPLGMFFINNSIIPLVYVVTYVVSVIVFQTQSEYQKMSELLFELTGFFAGFSLMIFVTAVYFNFLNKNTGSFIEQNQKNKQRTRKAFRKVQFTESLETLHFNRVDYYITNKMNLRHTRTVEHYDPKLHQMVFRRHHLNALIAFFFSLAALLVIGFFLENPFFQFPIALSAFLFISVLMSVFSMFIYWTGGWGSTMVIVFLITANYLTKYDLGGYQSRVYGLQYNGGKAPYNLEEFRKISSDENIESDKKYFLQILENWRKKNTDPKNPSYKPKMYFINVSGGGVRAGLYVTAVMQRADSLAEKKLFDKTFMISGASGGMFGMTYLRDLLWQKKEGFAVDLHDKSLQQNVSKDLLNPIALSILSNDALLPYHKFNVKGQQYYKDRGYMFEKFYCRNTGLNWERTISDFKQAEFDAKIPVTIYHTTVMNDSRRFYITPHPVSFLMRPVGNDSLDEMLEVDGIDFCRLFKKQNGDSLLVTSAMRMDATFPFILPNPVLPTEPPTYVMDGGALDNFGVETTLRFLKTFENWINKNTSGVVILQLRDSEKFDEPAEEKQKTLFSRMTDPLGTVYKNMENMQDFLMDYRLNDLSDELKGKLHFVLFEYTSDREEDKAAMSMHITSRDKNDILRSLSRPNNAAAFNKLVRLLSKE